MNDRTYTIRSKTIWNIAFLLVVAVMLGFGLAFVSPAAGAELQAEGDITGIVTLNGQAAAGINVELRQRSNAGADNPLASSVSDSNGVYHFANQPSAPNDAFYYIRFAGAKNTLAAWYTFPIIYVNGSEFTVPAVEMGDIELSQPQAGTSLALPGTLSWKARRSGETYRVFIYAKGKIDKVILDSGSLGPGTSFTIPAGGLAEGEYEAVVQVRDAVVGYGQSQARYQFTTGKPAAPVANTDPASGPAPGSITTGSENNGTENAGEQSSAGNAEVGTQNENTGAAAEPGASEGAEAPPQLDLDVKLSADKTSVGQGGRIVYTIEVKNDSDTAAEGVVVTDRLPDGVTVDSAGAKSSTGSVEVSGNNVTAQVGNLAPNEKVVIEIPATVSQDAGGSLSNQASVQYTGGTSAVQSNAYIAEVAGPTTGSSAGQPAQPPLSQPAQPPATQPEAPVANPPAAVQPQQPEASQPNKQVEPAPQGQPAAPPAKAPVKQPEAKQSAPIPQTGGAFPVALAVLLVTVTLLARYLRGTRYRRA